LVWVAVVVILVELLSRVKLLQLLYLSHYLSRMSRILPFLLDLLQHSSDNLLLFAVAFFVENNGPVLRSGIIALSVDCCGIMDVHEDKQDG